MQNALSTRGGRQQRALNLGRDLELLFELRLVERLAVEPGVLDRQGGFGRQRFERRPRRGGSERRALAAVEIQHADRLVLGLVVGPLDVADEPERHAQHVADAERHRPAVKRRQLVVQQVLDDEILAGGEDLLGNLAARGERAPRQGDLSARAGQRELERARRAMPA